MFEPLLDKDCALITDQLNHASLIDGARLCKAERLIYAHGDMGDLAAKLREASTARLKMIVTDGVFSMDGDVARLPEICALAEEHGALLMVDDSHATGFIGATGRGTAEHFGVSGRVDVITTTFGKALGGATGGCLAGPEGDRRAPSPEEQAVPVLQFPRACGCRNEHRHHRHAHGEHRAARQA